MRERLDNLVVYFRTHWTMLLFILAILIVVVVLFLILA